MTRRTDRSNTDMYARYVGRVGALAIALGVGGLFGSSAPAWAGPDPTSTSNDAGGSDTAEQQTDPPAADPADDAPTNGPAEPSETPPAAAPEAELPEPDVIDPTDDRPSHPADIPKKRKARDADTTRATAKTAGAPDDTSGAKSAPAASTRTQATPEAPAPVASPALNAVTTNPVVLQHKSAAQPQQSATPRATNPIAAAINRLLTAFTGGSGGGATNPLPWIAAAAARREVQPTAKQDTVAAISTSQPLARSTVATAAAPTAAAAPAPTGLLPAIGALVTGVGNLLGGLLGGLFNQPPTAAPVLTGYDPVTGTYTGDLKAKDPNNDAMTYKVTTAPTNGSAVINTAGIFTYTPTPAARAQAATTPATDVDQFTVTVTDARGAKTTVVVRNVPIDPNRAPTGGTFTAGDPDAATGRITGYVTATDPDGDPLTFTGPATGQSTKGGTVVVTATGSYTYTPSAQARSDALASPGADTDTFTVVASDGKGGTLAVPVSVTVSPANRAPVASAAPTVNVPDAATGRVTGGLNISDPDGDQLTYTITSQPGRGTVVIDSAGGFSYTPTDTARADAINTPGVDVDSFSVEITDGRGGVATVAVQNIVIAPANREPVATAPPSVGAPNPATGIVTGNLNITDPDGNPITYAVTTPPAHGTVTIDSAGTFTFTPGDQDRIDALTTTVPADSFTATATDGHGGSRTVTVSGITVAPAEAALLGSVNVGDGPQGIVISPDGTRAYVANAFGYTVSVINTADNSVIATIPMVNRPARLVLNADGSRAYVVGGERLTVIDTATNTVIPNISTPVGLSTGAVALSPDGSRAYVTTFSGSSQTASITVIDTATGSVLSMMPIPHPGSDIAITPDGSRLYVTDGPEHSVTVIETTTMTPVTTVPIGLFAQSVTINPAGTHAYVTAGNAVTVIDLATNTVVAEVAGTSGGYDLAFSPDGTRAYVPVPGPGYVYVIDTTTNTLITTVRSGTGAYNADASYNIAITPDGKRAFVTNLYTDTVAVLALANTNRNPVNGVVTITGTNPTNGSVTGSVSATDPDGNPLTYAGPVSTAKGTVTVSNDGSFVYTPSAQSRIDATNSPGADTDSFNVTVSDGQGGTLVVPVSITITPTPVTVTGLSEPQFMATNPAGTRGYVANRGNGTVSVVDLTTNTITHTITVGAQPGHVVYAPNGKVYVSNQGANTVSVIDPATNQVVKTIVVGSAPIGMEFAPNGIGYIARGSNNAITVIDWNTDTVIGSIPMQGKPVHMRLTPDGSQLWVSNQSAQRVTVINTATNQTVTTVVTGGANPTMITFNADGSRAYVTEEFSNRVTVVNTADYSIVTRISVGRTPIDFVIDPSNPSRAYVTIFNGGSPSDIRPSSVAAIDLDTNTVTGTIPVGSGPIGANIVRNSDGGYRLYVVNAGGTLSVIPL